MSELTRMEMIGGLINEECVARTNTPEDGLSARDHALDMGIELGLLQHPSEMEKRIKELEAVLAQVKAKIEEPLRRDLSGLSRTVLIRELKEILCLAKEGRPPTWEEKVRDWFYGMAKGLDTAGASEYITYEDWYQTLKKDPTQTTQAIARTLHSLGHGNEDMVQQLTAFLEEREAHLGFYLKERYRKEADL